MNSCGGKFARIRSCREKNYLTHWNRICSEHVSAVSNQSNRSDHRGRKYCISDHKNRRNSKDPWNIFYQRIKIMRMPSMQLLQLQNQIYRELRISMTTFRVERMSITKNRSLQYKCKIFFAKRVALAIFFITNRNQNRLPQWNISTIINSEENWVQNFLTKMQSILIHTCSRIWIKNYLFNILWNLEKKIGTRYPASSQLASPTNLPWSLCSFPSLILSFSAVSSLHALSHLFSYTASFALW